MLLGLHQMYAQSYCKLQSRGSVECANADIKDMTITWLRDNGCQDRHAGIKIVKLKTKSKLPCTHSPYKSM